jgi:sugar-specific transcriptional regulator TrmB
MDYSALSDFGLSKTEIDVYVTLLKLGNASSGDIIHLTNIQNSVVHFTLKRLIEKGLVTYFAQNRNKQYQAIDPKVFLAQLDDKRKNLELLMPQLLKMEVSDKEPQVFVYSGIQGVKQLLNSLLEMEGKEHHTLGSSDLSLMLGEIFWRNYHLRRAEKGIHAKLLFNHSLKDWSAERKYKNAEVRYIQPGYEPITEHIVRGETCAVILWLDPPVGVLYKNKKVAKSYEELFKLFWDNAERKEKNK